MFSSQATGDPLSLPSRPRPLKHVLATAVSKNDRWRGMIPDIRSGQDGAERGQNPVPDVTAGCWAYEDIHCERLFPMSVRSRPARNYLPGPTASRHSAPRNPYGIRGRQVSSAQP